MQMTLLKPLVVLPVVSSVVLCSLSALRVQQFATHADKKLVCHYHNMTHPGLSALEIYFADYWPGSSLSKLLLKLLLTPCQTRCCIFNAAPAEGSHQIFVSSSVKQCCTYTCWITQRPLSGCCPASSECHQRLQWRKVAVQGRPSIRPQRRGKNAPANEL